MKRDEKIYIEIQPTTNCHGATSNQQPATSNQQPATSNQQPATSNQQPLNKGIQDKANLFIALQKACVLHLLFLHKKACISSALNSNCRPYLSKNYPFLEINKGAKYSRSTCAKAEHQNNLVSLPPVYYTGFV